MNFKLWTREEWDAAINGNTWSMIKKYYIPRGIWINSYEDDGNQSKIIMKLVSSKKYDMRLNDRDMDCIKEVKIEYGKLSKIIVYQ